MLDENRESRRRQLLALKNSDPVNKFLGNARRIDCCAKRVVCSLASTEDLFSLDSSSNLASQLLLDFLKSWDRESDGNNNLGKWISASPHFVKSTFGASKRKCDNISVD